MNKNIKNFAAAGVAAVLAWVPLGSRIAVMYGDAGLARKDSGFMEAAKKISNHTDPRWTPAGIALVSSLLVGAQVIERRRSRPTSQVKVISKLDN